MGRPIKYAEEAFNMGMFILREASSKMGTFSDPQHTHPGIVKLESPPWARSPTVESELGSEHIRVICMQPGVQRLCIEFVIYRLSSNKPMFWS